jgi:hypothetical protein
MDLHAQEGPLDNAGKNREADGDKHAATDEPRLLPLRRR